jgi:hypothetical protein
MNTIHTYVRDPRRNNNLRGVLVAKLVNDTVYIGWSYVNLKAKDRFAKQRGIEIAEQRTETNTHKIIPHAVYDTAKKFAVQCARYFKNDNVLLVGEGGYTDVLN